MTESARPRQSSPLRSQVTSGGVKDTEEPRASRTPCQQRQGVFALGKRAEPVAETALPNGDDFDTREAVRNFQAYLDILRKWDEKEKREAERLPAKTVRCD